MSTSTIIWSIAGTDSGGGAGLAADQRASDAFKVHLCPVVAAVTAQNSRAVTHVEPLAPALIEAQLQALADDMPPTVVKTGLLGGVEQVRLVARWIDRLRAQAPVALVVDPVLGASTGATFADASTLAAYRDELVPRATVLTPNRREARALLGATGDADAASLPSLALRLRALGAEAVCITGGDSADVGGDVLDWVSSAQAEGWLAAPRVATPHHHGTGCTYASSIAAALAQGFVPADAAVLAKMATAHALRHARAAGGGAGPVLAQFGFASEPTLMPRMTFGEAPDFLRMRPPAARPLGLYALVDSAERVEQVLAAGVRTVQLRIKTPAAPEAACQAALRRELLRSVQACRAAGAELFVNDHWTLARELGASGVHLGQEDLLALGDDGRRQLAASGLALGVSSHSLWELCRARGLAPRYIACGPVWPTLTKAMPWRPQGLHNLRWWRHMAGTPVVAIGGILSPAQVRDAASCQVDGVCVVRALGENPGKTIPALSLAFVEGSSAATSAQVPAWPTPALGA